MNNKFVYQGEKLYSSAIYYYGSVPGKVQNTFRIILKLDEDICKDSLRSALDKCQERYPYLMVKIKKSIKELSLVYNDLPFTITHTKDTVTLGTEETNYHFLALSFYDQSLVLTVFHGLVDGRAAIEFLKTLLYYYVMEKYHETPASEGVRLAEDEIAPEEYTDPMTTINIDDSLKSLITGKEDETLFRIEKADKRITKGRQYNYRVKVPQSSLMNYCRTNDASPATLFSLLIARAAKRLNPETTDSIIGGLARDLRPALHAPKSHYSNVGMIFWTFDEKIQRLTFEKQNTSIRGRIILKNDEDTVKSGIRSSKQFYEFVRKLPFVWLKKALLKKLIVLNLGRQTFAVSYVGKSSFGSAEKHIREMYTDADCPGTNIMLEVNAINDAFFLSFVQEWKERLYFDAFCKEMETIGLDYEIMGEGDFAVADAKI